MSEQSDAVLKELRAFGMSLAGAHSKAPSEQPLAPGPQAVDMGSR